MVITKNSLENMILTANTERQAQIIGRACLALFNRQTESEQQINEAVINNLAGFCKQDAREGSITAKSFIKNKTLAEWQVEKWTKRDVRGTMRIAKYWRQLAAVSASRAVAA